MNKCKFYKSSYFLTSCYCFTICHIQCIYCFWKCYIYMYKLIWYLWVNINYFRFVYHGSASLTEGKFVFLLDSINDRNRFFKDLLGLCTLKRFFACVSGNFLYRFNCWANKVFRPTRSNSPNSSEKAIYKNLIYLSRYTLYICGHIYTYTYLTYVHMYHLTKWHHFTTCFFTLYKQLSVSKYR